jgi:hypothetical protein
MVCDGAMVASSLVSMMMNGVCCMYQMQEEDERREATRKDIRFEYERQKMMDMEYWSYRSNNNNGHKNKSGSDHNKRAYHSDCPLQEESHDHHRRRQRLMLAKNKTHSSSAARIDDRRHDVTSCPPPMVRTPPGFPERDSAAIGTPALSHQRVRSDPVLLSPASERRRERFLKGVDTSGEGSSLMDDDADDDDDYDELELFDVALA